MKQPLGLACLALALALAGLWVAHGANLATLTQRPVEKVVVDDFGDEEKQVVWEPTFVLGLDYGGPAAGLLFVLGGWLLFSARGATGAKEPEPPPEASEEV